MVLFIARSPSDVHRGQFSRPRKNGEEEQEEDELEVLSAVVNADDRDEYEDNEREEIEMGSTI